MVSQSLPDSTDGTTPQLVVDHQVHLVVGGLSTLEKTLSLIGDQAEDLAALDLVDGDELRRFQNLAAEVTDLVTDYREGRFFGRLRDLVDRARG